MSGRSAYVRKEKTKVKDGPPPQQEFDSDRSVSIGDFPLPGMPLPSAPSMFSQQSMGARPYNGDMFTIMSGSSSEERGYARVQVPVIPLLYESGIEKSSFRSMMDKKSETVRKGIAKTFSKKSKKDEDYTQASTMTRTDSQEHDDGNYSEYASPHDYHSAPSSSNHRIVGPAHLGPILKRWVIGNKTPEAWNHVAQDPEIWDYNGDTLVYFGRDDEYGHKVPPSLRTTALRIERTESEHLGMLLQQGYVKYENNVKMLPSPASSPSMNAGHPHARREDQDHQDWPISRNSALPYDGQILYELYFEPPNDKSPAEIMRYHVTTRNFFAILYHTSLVGYNFFQVLTDLQERLEEWMPPGTDAAGMIIDYIIARGFDDLRENPFMAVSLLAWSESRTVRWEEGWLEAFVHCCGMYSRLETCPELRHVSTVSRALLERSSLDMQVRIHDAETRLRNFEFGDMWPKMSASAPPAKEAFERVREFFLNYYKSIEGRWPPLTPAAEENWLNRTWAQKLQTDFGALYDYLVDRNVVWDGSEERSGRKWNIIKENHADFDTDSFDLPFTDVLVAFDNRHKYPHIPHPYCLVPDSVTVKKFTSDKLFKAASKKNLKQPEDKMALRKAALEYTNATNVFVLGPDFAKNDLVEEYIKFEKSTYSPFIDPYAARRGRWVLVYGILQVLATVSVDSPKVRYTAGVSYHLSPKMRGTPPWVRNHEPVAEADHTESHCWTVVKTWTQEPPLRFA